MKHKRLSQAVQIILMSIGFYASAAAEVTVQKDTWVKGMENVLPAAFCTDGSYFRSCFSIPVSECHKVATKSTASCLRQHDTEIPTQLIQPKDGSLWGQKVGTCAGTVFAATLKEKFISNSKCNDPSAWK